MSDLAVEHKDGFAVLTLQRTESRNALSDGFLRQIIDAVHEAEETESIGCVVIAGQEDYFSVGADLHELAALDPSEVLRGPRAGLWTEFRAIRTPLVAAVSGHCLGGGCELALSCDLVVAAETASFGQPETRLGLIPGGGGTQLLARAVGSAVAADMVLTGRRLGAREARELGLVARVCEGDSWLAEAEAVATKIAAQPRLGTRLAKQALGTAREAPFSVGVASERALYNLALADPATRSKLAEFAAQRRAR